MLFFCFHCSFAILEPSGKGWPFPGTPALYALIMVGLATITLSTSSVRAEETTAQPSYPLKSENAIPLGVFSEYLSCCAKTATPTRRLRATRPIANLEHCFFLICKCLLRADDTTQELTYCFGQTL